MATSTMPSAEPAIRQRCQRIPPRGVSGTGIGVWLVTKPILRLQLQGGLDPLGQQPNVRIT
jgi:hypothetical protein